MSRFVDHRAEVLEGCIPESGYTVTFVTSHRLMAGTSSRVSTDHYCRSPMKLKA